MKIMKINNMIKLVLSGVLITGASVTQAAGNVVHYKTSGLYAVTNSSFYNSTGCSNKDVGINLSEYKQSQIKENKSPDNSVGFVYISSYDFCSDDNTKNSQWSYAEIIADSILLSKNLSKASIVGEAMLETHEWVYHEDINFPENSYWEDILVTQEVVHINVIWTGDGSIEKYSNRNTSRYGNTKVRYENKGQTRNASVTGSIVGDTTNIQIDTSVQNENTYSFGFIGSSTDGFFEISHK